MLHLAVTHRLAAFALEVDLSVGPELMVLFGRSGAGKSMTLRAVAGLVRPDRSRIVLNSRILSDSEVGINLPPQARRIGYVPQSYALFPHLTVAQNVAYGLHKLSPQEAEHRVSEILSLVGLSGLEKRRPAQLSGGQQQRVALARALVIQPEALLLDEPLSALDAPTRASLRQDLRSLQRHFQIPVLFVTHNLAEAYFMADHIAVYHQGHILQVASPGEVLMQPAEVQVAELMGVKNIFPGLVVRWDKEEQATRVRIGQLELLSPLSAIPPGAPVWLCVRPERIRLIRPERLEDITRPRDNVLQGYIVEEVSEGTTTTLCFRLDALRLSPSLSHDLEIDLPVYVYERLHLAHIRRWSISLPRDAIHIIPQS
ncbi:MAG: ABC transporter ATP-binding protein [Chloroflexi bacterium]|nr:ABC transporter ATP-binding protein [Chloroflexota bacterium]